MASCMEISLLLSQAQERQLSQKDRISVRRHLLTCESCSRFQKQLLGMRSSAKKYRTATDQQSPIAEMALSSQARQRIAQTLRSQQHTALEKDGGPARVRAPSPQSRRSTSRQSSSQQSQPSSSRQSSSQQSRRSTSQQSRRSTSQQSRQSAPSRRSNASGPSSPRATSRPSQDPRRHSDPAQPSGSGGAIQAFIFHAGEFCGTRISEGNRLEIGRDLGCDIVLEDDLVSRRHAAITLFRNELYVEDLKSSNGTFLADNKVSQRKKIGSRDDIGIGRHTIKFKVLQSTTADSAPIAAAEATSIQPAPPMEVPPSQQVQPSPAIESYQQPKPAQHPTSTAMPEMADPFTTDLLSGVSSEDEATEVRPPLFEQPPASLVETDFPEPLTINEQDPAPDQMPEAEQSVQSSVLYDDGASISPLSSYRDRPVQESRHRLPNEEEEEETLSPTIGSYYDEAALPPSEPGIGGEETGPPPPEYQRPDKYERPDNLQPVQTDVLSHRHNRYEEETESGDFSHQNRGTQPLAKDLLEGVDEYEQTDQRLPEMDQPEPALPGQYSADYDDDDEYDPDDEPAPFSLLQNLLRETFQDTRVEQTQRPVLEVIGYRETVVESVDAIGSGQIYTIGQRLKRSEAERAGVPVNHKLARLRADGSADIVVLNAFSGKVHQQGGQRSIGDAADWHGEKGLLRLQMGDLVNLHIGPHNYFVRFAYPPALLNAVTRPSKATPDQRAERRSTISSFAASGGVHLSVLMVLFVISLLKPAQLVTQLDEDRFVQVEMEEMELEKPPEEEPEAEPPEEAEPEEIVPEKKPPKRPPKSRLSHPTGKTKKPGILAALGKIPKRSGAAGSQTLTAAVSNLDAVKVPGGGASYKVSGLIGKGPTNRVRIGGAGGGLATKGLASILREGGGGPGTLSKLKKGKVRGRLVKASRGSKLKGAGYLDRSEIQKVVNKGLGQIQFCYEKELLKNQSLSGKVVFEWTISTTGKVSIVKTKTATLRSPRATQCMINSIKGWKFPKPRGTGTVIVTYPFIFNSMGF